MLNRFVWPPFITEPRRGEDVMSREAMMRTRFLLRVAALHASEEGTLSALSEKLGLARGTIPAYASSFVAITPEIASKIETLTNGVVLAFYFRPDLFPPPSRTKA